MVTEGERWGGINQAFGIGVHHTTVYKTDDQQDLLCSTGNYNQYFIITYKRKEPEKEYMCVYNCIPETNTRL